MIWVLFATFILRAEAGALAELFKKPTCEPSETCNFSFQGMQLGFCSCPADHSCKYPLDFQGVQYKFCEKPQYRNCEEGEVAWVKRGFRQYVKCICQEPLHLHSQKWDGENDVTDYYCDKDVICDTEDICAVREHIKTEDGKRNSGFRELCNCPAESLCAEDYTVDTNSGEEKDFFVCKFDNGLF